MGQKMDTIYLNKLQKINIDTLKNTKMKIKSFLGLLDLDVALGVNGLGDTQGTKQILTMLYKVKSPY